MKKAINNSDAHTYSYEKLTDCIHKRSLTLRENNILVNKNFFFLIENHVIKRINVFQRNFQHNKD